MKNSIEEAIERLEYIDRTYSCNNYYSIWDLKCIEILLSDYKRVLKENEKIKSLIRKLKKDSKEQQWIQTADDEYLAHTEKAMYADELLSFLRGEE